MDTKNRIHEKPSKIKVIEKKKKRDRVASCKFELYYLNFILKKFE